MVADTPADRWQSPCGRVTTTEDDGDTGTEMELPPWQGPPAIPVVVVVCSVTRGTVRPISEDDTTWNPSDDGARRVPTTRTEGSAWLRYSPRASRGPVDAATY
jgi:hypothetical protein